MTRTQAAGAPHTEAEHETKDEKEPYRHTPRQCDRRTDKKKTNPGWRQQSSSKATRKKQRVTEEGGGSDAQKSIKTHDHKNDTRRGRMKERVSQADRKEGRPVMTAEK
jgi:hypothetical protein